MTVEADAMAGPSRIPDGEAPRLAWTRVFYWAVRRELWENRAIYLAPLAAAGVALLGFLISAFSLPRAVRGAAVIVDPKKHDALMGPYSFVAFAVLMTGLVVAVFYCLSALHGERRDRSILFWKSLPVSDLVTVLSKAAAPILVLPVVLFTTIVAAHLIVLSLSTLIVLANGLPAQALWSRVSLVFMWTVLANGLVFMALWYAPVYAWLLLVGGWAKRMAFVWAVAPLVAILIIEHLAFGKGPKIVSPLIVGRLVGGFTEPFSVGGHGKIPLHGWPDLDLARMFAAPGLWIGLLFAALFLFAAVRLRRSRDPI